MSEFHFRSISLEQMNGFSPNFIYAFILARSRLGLLWPLIDCFYIMKSATADSLTFLVLPGVPKSQRQVVDVIYLDRRETAFITNSDKCKVLILVPTDINILCLAGKNPCINNAVKATMTSPSGLLLFCHK